jgi:uncharacterized repeat protein (TIGR02543 family)
VGFGKTDDYKYGGVAGWYTDAECSDGNEWDFNTPVTNHITLYAKWDIEGAIDISGESETTPIDKAIAWLTANAETNTAYTLCLGANITAQPATPISDGAFHSVDNVTLTITTPDDKSPVTVKIDGSGGSLFTLTGSNSKTLALDGAVTLEGKDGNNAPLVTVAGAGNTLKLNGSAKISGNESTGGSYSGGVSVNGGTFIMEDGEICNNTSLRAGGVEVTMSGGTFEMNGGSIYGNSSTAATSAGGVVVLNALGGSTFTMNGGSIYGNTSGASAGAGGVTVTGSGNIFTMNGGRIQGAVESDGYEPNTNTYSGKGAIYVHEATAKFGADGGKIGEDTKGANADIDSTDKTIIAPAP